MSGAAQLKKLKSKKFVEGKILTEMWNKRGGHSRCMEIPDVRKDGHYAETALDDGLEHMWVKSGMTISLDEFEFCRIDCGIGLHFEGADEYDGYFEASKKIIDEWMAREEAGVIGEEYEPEKMEWPEGGIGRTILIGYGLTMRGMQRWETNKIDVSLTRKIDDGADLLEELAALGLVLAEKVAQQKTKLEKALETEQAEQSEVEK